jgi:hypothetical protein
MAAPWPVTFAQGWAHVGLPSTVRARGVCFARIAPAVLLASMGGGIAFRDRRDEASDLAMKRRPAAKLTRLVAIHSQYFKAAAKVAPPI